MNKKVDIAQSVLSNRLQLDSLLSLTKLLNLTSFQIVQILRIRSTNYTLHGVRSRCNEDCIVCAAVTILCWRMIMPKRQYVLRL